MRKGRETNEPRVWEEAPRAGFVPPRSALDHRSEMDGAERTGRVLAQAQVAAWEGAAGARAWQAGPLCCLGQVNSDALSPFLIF